MLKQGSRIICKSDVIRWIQSTLNIKLEQLQELGTGLIYCLLLNSYHPRTIPDSLINHHPRNQHQYLQNLKLFQSALFKLNYKRKIYIEKISKMKYQDNWDTISWLKKVLQGQSTDSKLNKQNLVQLQRRFKTPTKYSCTRQNQNKGCQNQGIVGIYKSSTSLGKSSITQTLLQNNYLAIIDRTKQVLVCNEEDSQKVRLLCMLLNVKMRQKQNRIDLQIKQLVE